MTSIGDNHQKHVKLAKPQGGNFGRNELGILGTPCSEIRNIVDRLNPQLNSRWKTVYIDADHYSNHQEPASANFSDKILFHRFDSEQKLEKHQQKSLLNDFDLLFVNGNHFSAERQIVVIDERKPLDKKLEKLTRVVLFLLSENASDIPPSIKNRVPDWQNISVFKTHQIPQISQWLHDFMLKSTPTVNGLVLAGGKSVRMKKDKSLIEYHGKPQREYAADLLSLFCEQTYISCRHDQVDDIDSQYQTIPDTFLELGPLGAILSAFRYNPNSAWFIIACDLPFIEKTTLEQLMSNRNSGKHATAFKQPDTEFPEPLIAIWEPKTYLQSLFFLSQGYSCPRKVLINSDVEIIKHPDSTILKNVNKPEEYEEVVKQLKNS